MKWLALAVALLTSSVAGAMDCQLAEDIADASEARWIYLEGIRDKVSGIVEKTSLDAEINALVELREKAIIWHRENCRSDNG